MVLRCLPVFLLELARLFDPSCQRASYSAMNSPRVRLRRTVVSTVSRGLTEDGDELNGLRIVLIIEGSRSDGQEPVSLWLTGPVPEVEPENFRPAETDGIWT